MKIDETAKRILNVLLDNSRLSYRQIAKKVGVSVVTILKRVKWLEKEKIIKAYTAELDYEKLGYDVTAIIQIRISHGKAFEVGKRIAADPHVDAMYNVTGAFDNIAIAKFKSRKAMDAFLKRIQTYEFIERTETILVLNTIKEKNIKVG
jgi:DNA-binding Lrp family transcriptional regulator